MHPSTQPFVPGWSCPICHWPVPDNEWVAFGKHEDCAMKDKPTTVTEHAAVRNGPEGTRHWNGRDY